MTRLRHFKNWVIAGLLAASTLRCGDNIRPTDPTDIEALDGDEQIGTVGLALPKPLVVLVTDASGNPVPGVDVQWAAQGGGNVSAATVRTGSNGRASVTRVLGPTEGQQTTTATREGLNGSPVTFTATAGQGGAPASIAITTNPPVEALDQEVFDPSVQPVVVVKDASGSPIGGVNVTASLTGGGSLQGSTTATSNSSGVAAFGDLGIQGTGDHTLEFTAGPASVTSSPVTIKALTTDAAMGKWGPVVNWDIVPLQMTLMPTGKIFAWGKREVNDTPADSMGMPRIWDPSSGQPPVGLPEIHVDDMLFCAGHTLLPDGRLMVAGGHFKDDAGIKTTYIFSPDGAPTKVADMRHGRWYPTLTVLADGRVLSMAGRDETGTTITIPEIWNGSQWTELPGGSTLPLPYYPRNFVDPTGRGVFMAGERVRSAWFNVSGTGSWTLGPTHQYGFNRDYGTAAMYDTGKILYAGGGGYPRWSSPPADRSDVAPTASAETIDLTSGSPTWQNTAPMQFARRHLNSTVLPDGEVLVTGGVGGGSSGGVFNFNDLSKAAHAAEIWSPKTGRWTTLASNAVSRGYHSVSLLLPDGTVLHGSGGDAQQPPQNPTPGQPYPREKNHEIFSPPYLFKGARPTIASAPATVGYGATFTVTTPNAAQVTDVRWIRIGSVTHAFDMSARANTLTFTRTATGVDVLAPADGNVAPPGHYLLFILNRNGVPSKGQFIKIQ